ncbi:hypothetical protein [Secundilactobacillus collinoides]|nr:hypothetical protein [Secundilactobacillus collinoides]
MNDADHKLLMQHDTELSDHERRINDLSDKMTDTLNRVDESNKYLREQNNRILEAVIRGNEKSDTHKAELETINRQNIWKVLLITISSSSLLYLIIQQIFHSIH